ncbi:hypothetical protein VTO58DRAFT_108916 [Aureobasidium pullulans]|nr:hypothetical protein JADG_005797 [Aureobasidium pullulans]
MHNDFGREDVVHRERREDGLSLDLALLSKIIVYFDSSTKNTTRRAHEASVFKLRKCAETARSVASIIAAILISSKDQVCRTWAAVNNLQQDLRHQTNITQTRESSLRKIVARFEDLRSDSAAEIATLQAGIEAANGRIVTLEEDSTAVMSQIAAREETTVAEMEGLRATILAF